MHDVCHRKAARKQRKKWNHDSASGTPEATGNGIQRALIGPLPISPTVVHLTRGRGAEHKKHKRHKKRDGFLVPFTLLVFRPLLSRVRASGKDSENVLLNFAQIALGALDLLNFLFELFEENGFLQAIPDNQP